MDALLYIVLPFVTLAVFVWGMGYRFYSWAKTPQPAKLTLFPAPSRGTKMTWGVLKESLLFPSLFKGDYFLWGTAWIFHAALVLIILGHLRVFTSFFDRLLITAGVDVEGMSSTLGGAAGIIIFAAVLLLALRRITISRVREITNYSDHFALLLILAIVLTGNLMRFGEHFDLNLTRDYFAHLFSFSFVGMTIPQNTIFQIHFLLVQLLIMYIPFSKILHFGGIFFTQILIKRS